MKHLLKLFFIITLFPGCGGFRPVFENYYAPTGGNSSLNANTKQGNYSVNSQRADDGYSSGSVNKVEVAATKNIGVIGSYTHCSGYVNNGDSLHPGWNTDKIVFETGAGYFNHFKSKAYNALEGGKSRWIYDVYGGMGFGSIHSDISMNFFTPFVQPGIGFRTKVIEFGFNLRLRDVKFYDFNPHDRDNTYLTAQNLIGIDKGSYLFMEPIYTVKIGYKYIKMEIQYIYSIPLSSVSWRYSGSAHSLGLSFLVNGYKGYPKTRLPTRPPKGVKLPRIYSYVDVMPQKGSDFDEYLASNLHYPVTDSSSAPSRIIVEFIVNEDGSLSGCKIIKGAGNSYDEQVIKVINNASHWIPGRQDGNPVKVLYTLAVAIYK